MTTQVESLPHNEGFIVSEANGKRSREIITLDSSIAVVLKAGTVLGKIGSSGRYVAIDFDASTGEEDAAAILLADFEVTGANTPVAALVRDAEVNTGELKWPAGATSNQKAAALAQLAALNIHGRAVAGTVETQTT